LSNRNELRSAHRVERFFGFGTQFIGLRLACNIQYTPGTKPALPAVSSKPPAVRPPATGADRESPPTGVDAAAASTASLDDLPPWQLPPDAPKPAIAPFDAVQAKEHQEAWADYLKLPVEQDFDLPGGEKLKMRLIPPGDFIMGSIRKSYFDEPHPVRITRPFYLGKFEVTQAQWEAVMRDNPSKFKGPLNPVETVSWNDIQPFLANSNTGFVPEGMKFKLPTEAQWEYACRAGTTTAYSFGDSMGQLHKYAWFPHNSKGTTHPAGELLANAWDLHDMHGNVWEWSADRYADYGGKVPLNDPVGKKWRSCVLRGGGRGKAYYSSACYSASRYHTQHFRRVGDERYEYDFGFRLACEIPFPPQQVSDATDVLQKIDLERDGLKGTWSLEEGALVVPHQEEGATLRLPLEITGGYRLELEVVNFAGGGRPLGIMLPLSEGSVSASFDSHGNEHATGLELVDGMSLFRDDENETRITSMAFQRGVPSTIVITVQPDRIQAVWDGRTAIDWQGDQSRLSLKYGWPNPGGRGLYLSMYNGGFRFTKISYMPAGKPAEPAPASSSPPAEPNASAEASQATSPDNADEAKPDEQAGAEEDSADTVRTWTDTSGKTVEAAFVEVKDGMVRLRLPDGKIAEVPLERLSKQDQTCVSEQAERNVAP
jgi:formylglycine-generating enzyme required for sulfatase activity